MNPDGAIQVSPRHHVMLDEDYWPMIDRAPREDFVVRTLAKRTAGDSPLMTAELVIASGRTRAAYPLAERFPLHFRKTYYPGRLHGDPRQEFDRHTLASTMIAVPPPIGWTPRTFRSCLLPGTPLNRLSELGVEPDTRNIALAQAMPLAAQVGLWRLLEEAFAQVLELQANGLTHGDAHLHNFIVCPSPAEVLPIDFERALVRDDVSEERWQGRCLADQRYLLQQGVFLLCALGRQRGVLADLALERLADLVSPAEPFRKAMVERTYAGATS